MCANSNNNPRGRRPDGMTLVEAVVVIGAMTLMLLIVNQIFIINYQIVARQTGRLDSDGGAVLATRLISSLTRSASSVVPSATINGTSYSSGPSTLVLEIPSVDASGNLISGSSDYVAISRDPADQAHIITDTAPAAGSVRVSGKKLVTAYNTQLVFRYNDSDIASTTRVSAYLENQSVTRGIASTNRGWTSLFLRNSE